MNYDSLTAHIICFFKFIVCIWNRLIGIVGKMVKKPYLKSVTHLLIKCSSYTLPKEIRKMYKSRDTPLEFCRYQHSLTRKQRFCYIGKHR